MSTSERTAVIAIVATALAMTAVRSDVNIFHAPVCAHRPADDGIVVVADVRSESREPRIARRLHAPLLVGGAALQHRGLPRPFPRQAKAHQALRALFTGERRVEPGG